jgi:hypothetical protein
MKVYIRDREWYPIYDLEDIKDKYNYPVDLSEEFIEQYFETKFKMENMLGKIEEYIRQQGGPDYDKE